jgi:hypothetical protein
MVETGVGLGYVYVIAQDGNHEHSIYGARVYRVTLRLALLYVIEGGNESVDMAKKLRAQAYMK